VNLRGVGIFCWIDAQEVIVWNTEYRHTIYDKIG
jgi:hypothetical protein